VFGLKSCLPFQFLGGRLTGPARFTCALKIIPILKQQGANLPYGNRKNRYAVFFHAVFRHFLSALLFSMPKNRPMYQVYPGNSAEKNGQP
jgi:hypothetical protein